MVPRLRGGAEAVPEEEIPGRRYLKNARNARMDSTPATATLNLRRPSFSGSRRVSARQTA